MSDKLNADLLKVLGVDIAESDLKEPMPSVPKLQYPPIEVSFGLTVKVYPNGNVYISKVWPLGKPKGFEYKKKHKAEKLATVHESQAEEV